MSNIQKTLSSHPVFLMMFNSSYRANQPINDRMNNGSRNDFQTDIFINGDYFRSRTNNQYFCVVDKKRAVELSKTDYFAGDFRELEQAIKIGKYNPEKDVILRLDFSGNKSYFVESYQAISIRKPDFTVVDIPLGELRKITPKFEPLPYQT